jgi:hypothetical protein
VCASSHACHRATTLKTLPEEGVAVLLTLTLTLTLKTLPEEGVAVLLTLTLTLTLKTLPEEGVVDEARLVSRRGGVDEGGAASAARHLRPVPHRCSGRCGCVREDGTVRVFDGNLHSRSAIEFSLRAFAPLEALPCV